MIDILLAVYNGESYLAEQLESIFKQSYKNFRLIIFDDGSTDSSEVIIGKYIKKYEDKKIKYIRSYKNSGSPVKSFSKLLSFVEADYIAFCDQDDVWHEDKLTVSLKAVRDIEKNFLGSAVLVYSDLFVVDENLNLKNSSFFNLLHIKKRPKKLQELIVQNNVTGCSLMFNKKLWELCSSFPKQALMHDWWLALVATAFGRVFYMDIKTVYYRQHKKNTVGAKNTSNISYIFGRFFDRFNIKKGIDLTYLQCEAFLKIYENLLDEKQKKILTEYIKIKGCSKPKKILKLISGGYLKNGLLRKIGQIIYI